MKKENDRYPIDVFFSSVICFKESLLQHHVVYSISFNELTHERAEDEAYSTKKKIVNHRLFYEVRVMFKINVYYTFHIEKQTLLHKKPREISMCVW